MRRTRKERKRALAGEGGVRIVYKESFPGKRKKTYTRLVAHAAGGFFVATALLLLIIILSRLAS
jgi:hypothetical protein